jgi:ribosomal protein S18 acetylase RimI-like enzyme
MYAACVDGGKVVGYVQLQKLNDGNYSFRRFAVLPDYQKLGIGRALVSHCRDRAALYGGKKMTLMMINDNQKLKDFYLSCGFRVVRTANDGAYPFEYSILELEL